MTDLSLSPDQCRILVRQCLGVFVSELACADTDTNTVTDRWAATLTEILGRQNDLAGVSLGDIEAELARRLDNAADPDDGGVRHLRPHTVAAAVAAAAAAAAPARAVFGNRVRRAAAL